MATYRPEANSVEAEAAFQLGVQLVGEDRLTEAEQSFARADEQGHGAAAFNLGVLLAYRGDLDGAEAAYGRAAARDVDDAAFELAMLLLDQQQLPEAEVALVHADQRGHARAAAKLAMLLEERGDIEGAASAYRRADERGDADGAFAVGMLLLEQDRLAEAEDAFARAEQRGHPTAAHNLVVVREYRQSIGSAEAGADAGQLHPGADDFADAGEPAFDEPPPVTGAPDAPPKHAEPAEPAMERFEAVDPDAHQIRWLEVAKAPPEPPGTAAEDEDHPPARARRAKLAWLGAGTAWLGARTAWLGASTAKRRRRWVEAGIVAALWIGIAVALASTLANTMGHGKPTVALRGAVSADGTSAVVLSGTVSPAGPHVTADLYRLVSPERRELVTSKQLAATGGSFRARIERPQAGRYVLIVRTVASARYAADAWSPVELP